MLVDHSLLLGSFTKGVHVHDIVLTYLRNTHSPSELRALQKRVVEELVRVSTARPFEDTGSTSKGYAGEEVDWYVCNVGSFHIKQSMDRSVPVAENKDVARWLMVDDAVLFQQTALAAGEEELGALVAHFSGRSQWVEAAKVRWAVYYVSSSQTVMMMDEVMALLEKCGPTRTSRGLQLELDVISSYRYQGRYVSGSAERTQIGARIAELTQNPSLRTNPWNLVLGGIFPKVVVLFGATPKAWEDGKRPDGDSVLKGMGQWYSQATPLMQSACDNAVGARKVTMVAIRTFQIHILTRHIVCSFCKGMVNVSQALGNGHRTLCIHRICHGGERSILSICYRRTLGCGLLEVDGGSLSACL
jgi:hypothetical protein